MSIHPSSLKMPLFKLGSSILVGWGLGRLSRKYAYMKKGTAFDGLHHYQAGMIIAPFGAVVPEKYKPIPVGVGTGLVIDDIQDFIQQKGIRRTTIKGASMSYKKYDIPDNLSRREKYQALSDILKGIKREGERDPEVRDQAIKITEGIDGRDDITLARRVQRWTNENIEYKKDPVGMEAFSDPKRTIRVGAGDCDDQALLTSSLLGSIGVPSVGLLYSQKKPKRYHHIITGVLVDPRQARGLRGIGRGRAPDGRVIIPIETIDPRGSPLGYEPRYKSRALINW